jgi:hypothetical protein
MGRARALPIKTEQMLGEAKRRVRAAGPTYSPIISLILLHKTYLNLPKITLDKLVFTDNAVGSNVVEGVGYPKISRLSPIAQDSQFNMVILAFKSGSIDIPQDGQS